ncbi:hypothetical protein P9112_012859 [Eukaryota sp. TZLM1-RC]
MSQDQYPNAHSSPFTFPEHSSSLSPQCQHHTPSPSVGFFFDTTGLPESHAVFQQNSFKAPNDLSMSPLPDQKPPHSDRDGLSIDSYHFAIGTPHEGLLGSYPTDRKSVVNQASSSFHHTLLLTYSGEVYAWGCNDKGQVLYDGPKAIKSPIKLPITNISTISAGNAHSFALSSDGELYGWGSNELNQINMSNNKLLPITQINIPYNIKEVFGGHDCSFALTEEGQVLKWGDGKSFEYMAEFYNIVYLCIQHQSIYGKFTDCIAAIDNAGDIFYWDSTCLTKIQVTKYFNPRKPFKSGISFVNGGGQLHSIFVVADNGNVWRFNLGDFPFMIKPIKVSGLSNVVSIFGQGGFSAVSNAYGKVIIWGKLKRLSDLFEDRDYKPICFEAFTNVEGISVGDDFLFAYKKNTVWAWGRNHKGQLGTGDLIDRPQPVKVFGSELFDNFQYPKQPLDSMFSGLIKFVYWEYLNYLVNLFGNHPYVKARFYTKCGISKRVAQFAQELFEEVFNDHPVQNKKFLKDPQDLTLTENICDLQLQISTDYDGPVVINPRIKKLDVFFIGIDYDPDLLSLFPNFEVAKLGGWTRFGKLSENLAHLSNLKYLELTFPFIIEELPTSLVKLVLQNDIEVADLSYLTSLQELVVSAGSFNFGYSVANRVLEGQIPLPQSLIRLEVWLQDSVFAHIQLPNLKELIIDGKVPTNITEQNFPALKFIQLIRPEEFSLVHSPLSLTTLINQGLIKSVKPIKNEYLVELSCFPWWVQYPASSQLYETAHNFHH